MHMERINQNGNDVFLKPRRNKLTEQALQEFIPIRKEQNKSGSHREQFTIKPGEDAHFMLPITELFYSGSNTNFQLVGHRLPMHYRATVSYK